MIKTILLSAIAALAAITPATAETDAPKPIDLELFAKADVDRSKGCSVVLWQDDRDPETDKFAYVFAETLTGENHTRKPARIKIGGSIVTLKRVATGGKTTGYDVFEYQLYQLPAADEFVVLQLKLAEEEGESIDVESGKMSIIMKGKPVFRTSVKGNAGCMTPAAAAEPAPKTKPEKTKTEKTAPDSNGINVDPAPGMFERYDVPAKQVPAKILKAAQKQFGCEAAIQRKDVTGFQLSEESAIWQLPCGEYAKTKSTNVTSAVYALVYLPKPEADYTFLPFKLPKGVNRGLGDHALMDPKWDMKTRTVTGTHMEGDGTDCGQFERYVVTEDGGFKLLEFRAKDACDGKSVKPQDFPLVFKAK